MSSNFLTSSIILSRTSFLLPNVVMDFQQRKNRGEVRWTKLCSVTKEAIGKNKGRGQKHKKNKRGEGTGTRRKLFKCERLGLKMYGNYTGIVSVSTSSDLFSISSWTSSLFKKQTWVTQRYGFTAFQLSTTGFTLHRPFLYGKTYRHRRYTCQNGAVKICSCRRS